MLLLSLKIEEREPFHKSIYFNWLNNSFLVYFFLLFIFFQSSSYYSATAQISFSKKNFTTDNGLSNNFVQDISEDKNGFLWISTWDGLNRFDGYEFKRYFHKPTDSTSFPFFLVEKTVVDELNNIWVVCPRRNMVRYNRKKDNFEQFKPGKHKYFVASDIVAGNEKDIWLLGENPNSLYHYDLITTKLDTFPLFSGNENKQPSFDYVPELMVDNKGTLWIAEFSNYNFKIYKSNLAADSNFYLSKYKVTPANYSELAYEKRKQMVYHIYVDSENVSWLFTSFGLFYMTKEDNQFRLNSAKVIPGNFKEQTHLFWSDLKSGIHFIDTKEKEILNIKTNSEEYTGSIFIDSQNTIWTGNVNTVFDGIGLNRFIKTPDLIKNFLTEKNEYSRQNLVLPILKDKYGDIWVGTIELNYLFKSKPDGTISKVKFLNNYKGDKHPKAKSMLQDSLGIWIGCTEDVLVYYDHATTKFTSYSLKSEADISISDIGLHNILKVKNNIIINGFNNRTGIHAIYKFNTDSRLLETALNLETPYLCMVKDGNEGFWLGSIRNIVLHLDKDFKQIDKFQIGNGETLVEHICLGDNNDIWVALMGGGLGHLKLTTEEIEIFTLADGLSSNTVSSILKDKQGNLWLSTNQGVSRFNPLTKHFRNFGQAEGVMIREFNSDSYFQTPDGKMLFGGVGGMIQFHPDSVEKKLTTPQSSSLLITDFSVSGISRYSIKPIYETDTIALEKGDNNFQLTFAKIELNYPEKINYRHRLSGTNYNWIETDYRHRDISYANLVPGKYKLELEATNIEGDWDTAKTLTIQLPGFYYQTLWFKFGISILIVAIVTTFIVVYIRQIRITAKQKQAELKLESLRGQMNPHFIFNSLNSINYFISNNDKRSANSYIADFSSLIRNFLSNLSCDYVPVEKELKILNDYLKLEHLRFGDKFDYSICTKEIPDKSHISIFPGIVQPFIENAIWHGIRGLENRKGDIEINFILENKKTICCTIEDDGVGRKLSEKYSNRMPGKKSRGIGIVMERLSVVNNISQMTYGVNIKDKYPEREETGTIVTIHIPIKYMVEQECL